MILSVDEAIKLLQKGEVVALPTETVYGLAAVATNPEAIACIFKIKDRPADNPLICHFHSISQIENFVSGISSSTKLLMEKFSPGPISFMLDLSADSQLKFATSGNDQVIARIPRHKIFLAILEKLEAPLAAPSANTSGKVSPTSSEMVEKDLGDKIAGIVEGGISNVGLESTIIDARNENEVFILRPGSIGTEEIQKVLPDVVIHNYSLSESTPATPGAKYRHYAPNTPLYAINSISEVLTEKNFVLITPEEGLLHLSREEKEFLKKENIPAINLGSVQNLPGLAQKFYQNISSADQLNVSKAFILQSNWGKSSLGEAMSNRLEKMLSVYTQG